MDYLTVGDIAQVSINSTSPEGSESEITEHLWVREDVSINSTSPEGSEMGVLSATLSAISRFPLIPLPRREASGHFGGCAGHTAVVSINSTSPEGSESPVLPCSRLLLTVSINSTSPEGSE